MLATAEEISRNVRCASRRSLNITRSFFKVMKGRDRRLPRAALHRYLEAILAKKGPLLESVHRFGSPQYFFDEPALAARISLLHQVFSKHCKRFRVFYAMKSNCFQGICKRVVEAGMGLDASSGLELSMALALNCRHIVFSGPGKTDEELVLAVENGQRVTILMDSGQELERISRARNQFDGCAWGTKVGIRVRGEHHGVWSKFGVPLKEIGPILKKAATTEGVQPFGIQFHTSWNLDPAAQVAMIGKIGSFVREKLPRRLWETLRFLDIGGGYWPEHGEWLNPENTLRGRLIELLRPGYRFSPVHYFREAYPLDLMVGQISEAIALQGPPLCDVEIWTEPGRWISHPAMHILLRVVDKKGPRTVITDGGTNLLGWERALTEFIPVLNLSRPSLRRMPCMVFGSLCTPYDIWGTSFFGDGIELGDVLMVPDQGAYTYSLRQSFIKPKARVVQYNGTSLEEVEKEESYPPSP